jgi:phosphosulfolactate synthase (CoM biosynthesis protein A)
MLCAACGEASEMVLYGPEVNLFVDSQIVQLECLRRGICLWGRVVTYPAG